MTVDALNERRWRGQPGRLEVWYTTVHDPGTGAALWLHTELVAPSDGGPAFQHGWAALFAPDAAPVWERFGPVPVDGSSAPEELIGRAGELAWDLRRTSTGGDPLYTFPRYAWQREVLPAAQVVSAPSATYSGRFRYGERTLDLVDAPGASARIYGHGNAQRWAWLHANLGGGDVLELVSAVSRKPVLSTLPPLTLVQLRVDGVDRPRDPLTNAVLVRARLGLPEWRVRGWLDPTRRRRISVTVRQDPARTAVIGYTDPDGATATCHNSELATAWIRVDRLGRRGWQTEREWHLDRTAHAEIGWRP